MSIPIFDHGRSRHETEAARNEANAAAKSLADATARALVEVEALNVELAAANDQRGSFEKIIVESKELVRIAEVG
ncbi:hypothetical protein ABTK87_19260, partial [Acinetobacter baumannii]